MIGVDKAIKNLDDLLLLQDDWDAYGAKRISPEAVARVKRMLHLIDSFPPSVVPMNNGGVQVEWHGLGCNLEIEVEAVPKDSPYYEQKDLDALQVTYPTS